MNKQLLILGFFLLSLEGIGQMTVQIIFQGTRDSVHFVPVENVQLKSNQSSEFLRFYHYSDTHPKYWLNDADTTVFDKQFKFHHPEYTFPEQRLIDFPYEIQNDKIIFTITGFPIPTPVVHRILIPAASSKKRANSSITLGYLALDAKDSVILVNNRGKFIALFEKPESNGGIHILSSFEPKKEHFQYKIINLSNPDTLEVDFSNWMFVLPQVSFQPIQRSDSELRTLKEYFKYLEQIKLEHEVKVSQLSKEISHLKDSITKILNPKQNEWYRNGSVIVPSEGIIDGVFIPNDSLRRNPTKDPSFEQDIIELVQSLHPEKTGKIYLEVSVDMYGDPRVLVLSESKEFEFIEQMLQLHFETFDWKPTPFINEALGTTHLFELIITEK
ncbi:MAG: hypothetical protein ACFHU9_13585 [Fluviicola sp.]